ncbi:V protein [Salem virus]|uniref:Non-structural protein V n=1 Tax=Salem virus TaxID=120499 RepID=Q9IZC0_9MONO|nr:V protein [Salem virus]AAF63742.1 V protein [Salem virus]
MSDENRTLVKNALKVLADLKKQENKPIGEPRITLQNLREHYGKNDYAKFGEDLQEVHLSLQKRPQCNVELRQPGGDQDNSPRIKTGNQEGNLQVDTETTGEVSCTAGSSCGDSDSPHDAEQASRRGVADAGLAAFCTEGNSGFSNHMRGHGPVSGDDFGLVPAKVPRSSARDPTYSSDVRGVSKLDDFADILLTVGASEFSFDHIVSTAQADLEESLSLQPAPINEEALPSTSTGAPENGDKQEAIKKGSRHRREYSIIWDSEGIQIESWCNPVCSKVRSTPRREKCRCGKCPARCSECGDD